MSAKGYGIDTERELTSFHFLKGFTSCLRSSLANTTRESETKLYLANDKPRIDDQGPVEDTEHQECPPANIGDGMRSDLRESKVEQPLSCGSCRNTCFSESRWEDLGHIKLSSSAFKLIKGFG